MTGIANLEMFHWNTLGKAILGESFDNYCDAKFLLKNPDLPKRVKEEAEETIQEQIDFFYSEDFDYWASITNPFKPEEIVKMLDDKVQRGDHTHFYVAE